MSSTHDSEEYENALQTAAFNEDDVSMIKLLLKTGADVNAQIKEYENALQRAAFNEDDVSMIKLLLKANADVNA